MKKVRFLTLFLSFCLILSACLPLAAFADGESHAEDGGETEWIIWEYTSDGTAVTDGKRTLERYELPFGIRVNVATIYVFDYDNGITSLRYSGFHGGTRDGSIVWSCESYESDDEVIEVYTDASGRQSIERLANGQAATVRFMNESGLYYTDTEKLYTRLTALTGGNETKVSDLRNLSCITLLGFDETDTVARELGGLFMTESGSLLYVDYLQLDNTHFDADGHLSFRSGTVNAIPVEPSLANELRKCALKAEDTRMRRIQFQSSQILYEDPADDEDSQAFFWIFLILCGYIFPFVPLVLGFILPHVGKRKKRWYALAIAAGVWLLCAVGITVLII